jgi:cell division protein FtsQ
MPVEMEDPDGDDPTPRRERFNGVPRRPWWRPAGTTGRVLVGVAAFVVLAGIAIAYQTTRTFLSRDSRFRIEGTGNVQATGLSEVSRAEILPIFGEDVGRNIFFVPLGERRKQIEQLPWVQSATVMRLLPDQLRVEVVERQPVAFVRQGGQIGLVDANGVLLTMPPAAMAQHHYSFPVLTGIDAGDSQAGRKKRVDLYQRLMGELDANGQHITNQISEIDLTDPEDARVTMQEQGTDIQAHFGEDHFLDRYRRYKAHIAEWRAQYPKLAGVDLRYEQQVVLQMAPGAGTDQATANADGTKPADAAKPAETAKSEPVKAAEKTKGATTQTAKSDAPKHAASTKPASVKHASAKAGAKAAKGKPKAKAKTAAELRADRVKKLELEQRKRAHARRAEEQKSKQKSASKPQTPAAAGQGQ